MAVDDRRPTVDVGVLVATTPAAEEATLREFAAQSASDAAPELADATAADWQLHREEATRLPDASARRPSDFLDEAMLRMAEGPYDVVLVVTDAPLRNRRHDPVPGLASPVGRIAVVSTRRLTATGRDQPRRPLDDPAVRWNAATLVCHLVGHVLGARHDSGTESAMAPFEFDPDRSSVPSFDADVERYLRRVAGDVPDEESTPRGPIARFAFHLVSAARNPGQVLAPLVRSRAPLLPLSFPRLATAAVAPTLVLVFSAETWDVGIHLDDVTAGAFAVASVVAAAYYLTSVQKLLFPREPRRVLTEHMALVNVAAFLTMLGTTVGLFVMVTVLMLGIEFLVFPPDLVTNWPTLEDPQVSSRDLGRTAVFIATVGVLTGALAGGLESRTAIRHLALFLERP